MLRLWILLMSLWMISNCSWKSDEHWAYRRNLPKNADEVKEYYWRDELIPDYEYYLKAKMSKEDFIAYIDTFKLKPFNDSIKFEDDKRWLSFGGVYLDSVSSWWLSDTNIDSCFVWQQGEEWNIAKHENGYMYFYAHEH